MKIKLNLKLDKLNLKLEFIIFIIYKKIYSILGFINHFNKFNFAYILYIA